MKPVIPLETAAMRKERIRLAKCMATKAPAPSKAYDRAKKKISRD